MTVAVFDQTGLLTRDQVMERLLCDAQLGRVAMTCVLPAVRCGEEWRFRKSDLDAWIAAQYGRADRNVPKS